MAEAGKPATRRHRAALTRYLRATGLVHVPEASMVVEMLRDLALELDEGGGQRPRAEYRQYIKLANSLFDTTPRRVKKPAAAAPAEPSTAPAAEAPAEPKNDLLQFRERHNIA
jgi:hypothetical protein